MRLRARLCSARRTSLSRGAALHQVGVLAAIGAMMIAGAAPTAALAQSPPPPDPAPTAEPSSAPLVLPPSPEDAGNPKRDKADELFAQGNAAFDAGKLKEAYALYLQAWSLKRTYDIAGNLGQVELKLGQFRDAAEHLAFTLDHFPPTGKSAPREAIRSALDAARKEVGALRIRTASLGAEITIDGVSVGRAPLPTEVFVSPGDRTIEATLPAHLPTKLTITVKKGEKRDIDLTLTPKAVPAAAPRSLPLLITGYGVSLAAAGVGLGLMIAADRRGAEADLLLEQLVAADPDGVCPCGTAEERAALKGQRSEHDTLFNTAIGMFVGAGVVAIGSTVYALSPGFQKPKPAATTEAGRRGNPRARGASLQVAPVLSPRSAGVFVVGSF